MLAADFGEVGAAGEIARERMQHGAAPQRPQRDRQSGAVGGGNGLGQR